MSEELLNTTVEQEYDASQIQVLEGLEAVRKRPGMYIGSTSASGLHHLVYEIVDNAIDEALAGYCTHITVTINPGDTITVTDNGRGIPVDIQAQTGRPALEVVYTVLHAGGKFGGGGYKVSGGLHGVGASVVNALSEWLTVEVHKEGKIYQMKFARGNITQEMRVIGNTDRHGTIVTFKPDPEMFDTLTYDYETLHTRMREQAFLNAGLRIEIADRRTEDGPSDSMCYEGGIREFVLWHNRHKTPLHEEVVYMAGVRRDAEAEVALQYHDGYNETIVSFANNIHTPEGGMHETGFKTALTRVLNAYGTKTGVIKTDADKVSGEDCREGLTAVISVKLTDAQFEGQTKAKLGNAYIRTLVDSIVNEQLSTYFEEHPAVARTILEKAMTANRAREAARKARESIRRKTALGGAAMPDKLRDCRIGIDGRNAGHLLQRVDGLLQLGVVLQRDDVLVAHGLGGHAVVHDGVIFLDERLQSLLAGDEAGIRDIVDQIDAGADALGLGLGVALVDADEDLVLLLQIVDDQADVIGDKAEARDDHEAGHGDADCGKGHKAMLEDRLRALADEKAEIIVLHSCNTRPFRR